MAGARLLLYSHDSYGLGHLRRTLALAAEVTRRDAAATALIVTGSSVASSYRLPERVDTVKLPVVTKEPDGRYEPLRLGVAFRDLRTLRSRLLLAAAEGFAPDVLVVDKSPLGLRRELLPALERLKSSGGCRMVLGLRDIEDSPARVRREWRDAELRERIRRYYDHVLVYGPATTLDALDCLGWGGLGMPIDHVGYVGARIPHAGPPDLPGEYLLVTVGGGGDGARIVTTFLEAIRSTPLPCPAVVVTGPLMRDADTARIAELAADLPVVLQEFRADMESVIAGARAVVAMAGYNTVAELLAAGKPALLVPRIRPRREQLMRAQALADARLAELLHPDRLAPGSLAAALERLLHRPHAVAPGATGNGAAVAAEIILRLAGRTSVPSPALSA